MRAIQFQAKRVGSTFLQKAINSHPDIVGIDEIFVNVARMPGMKKSGFDPYLRSPFNDPEDYMENVIYKKYPNNTIFKLMYNQINWHIGLMKYINENEFPMIHVIRKNLLKQVISGKNAGDEGHNPINVTANHMLKYVMEAENDQLHWAERFKDRIKLTLIHEDLFGEVDGEKTYLSPSVNDAICNFFNVPKYDMFAKTKKKNKDDVSVYLPNIDSIRRVFSGTKYDWMIDGD